ncbi:MAP7 domain-containing protein 2-like isoform X2 [Gouania willdenowi]|uniref:MAP7 domain-containing protein 2-like isoform X2 n=1 Tax=Gouania willdenowi TaxID=441366 RepID=UPI0010551FF1|nr:MAP7 domain-containing protein 2-like isoform X2 [Gouania willdenowi]
MTSPPANHIMFILFSQNITHTVCVRGRGCRTHTHTHTHTHIHSGWGRGLSSAAASLGEAAELDAVTMAQLSSSASPSLRRRSDASATESLFFFVSERNQQEVRHTGTRPGTDRSKRWTWGGSGEEVVSFLAPPPTDQPINKQQLFNSTTIMFSPEKVSFNNKKKSVSNRRSVSGLPEEQPSGETLNSPVRSSSFRATSKSPASTPKRGKSNRKRAQTHCFGQATPPQPHHRATTPEVKGHSTLDRKSNDKKIQKSTSRENNAGMTDAEEASRVLMEKRRLVREQKEEQRRSQLEVKDQPETVQQEDEERHYKEQRWKEMQEQLDRDRELVVLRVKCEAQKKEHEMQKLHLQAEKERQQRKKRIDEIMKRTRKSDVESPTTESVCHVTPEDVTLGQLDTNVCVDELSDGVQSMDVSPVSRDEQPSIQDFSLAEGTVGVPVPLDQSGCAAPGLGSTSSLGVGVLNRNLIVTSH